MKERLIQRGQIYYAHLGKALGSEQGGSRPVLVIQNNKGNWRSPTIIVADGDFMYIAKENSTSHPCFTEEDTTITGKLLCFIGTSPLYRQGSPWNIPQQGTTDSNAKSR